MTVSSVYFRSRGGGSSDQRQLENIEKTLRSILENVGHLMSKVN